MACCKSSLAALQNVIIDAIVAPGRALIHVVQLHHGHLLFSFPHVHRRFRRVLHGLLHVCKERLGELQTSHVACALRGLDDQLELGRACVKVPAARGKVPAVSLPTALLQRAHHLEPGALQRHGEIGHGATDIVLRALHHAINCDGLHAGACDVQKRDHDLAEFVVAHFSLRYA